MCVDIRTFILQNIPVYMNVNMQADVYIYIYIYIDISLLRIYFSTYISNMY